MTIQMKATEQYFPVVVRCKRWLYISLDSVDEILMCDHSNESY